jgi:hypothetical protein
MGNFKMTTTLKYILTILILFLFSFSHALTKKKVDIKKIIKPDSLNTTYQIGQFCEAYSSDKNATESKGEAHSVNKAISLDTNFNRSGFFIILDNKVTTVEDSRDSNLCHELYVVNNTDSAMHFGAQDIYVYIVIEAIDLDNIWKPISYISGSFCGNSYHTVILDKKEFWKFKTPIFNGNYKTKIRCVLYADRHEGKKYYSNEIPAKINLSQFDRYDYFWGRLIKQATNPFD